MKNEIRTMKLISKNHAKQKIWKNSNLLNKHFKNEIGESFQSSYNLYDENAKNDKDPAIQSTQNILK